MSSKSSVSLGVALLVVGAFFFFFAGGIETSAFAGKGDPGPRAIPVTLSIVLMLGGLIEIGVYAKRGRAPKVEEPSGKVWLQPGNKKVVVFTTMLLVYLITIPFAFYTSTFVFAALAVWYLGARWWAAFLVSAAIVTVVWVLFVRLFLVPLPTLLDTLTSSWRTL